MDFFDKAGIMTIGTRFRMLNEKMTEDANKIYPMYNVDMKPKWFPVFYIVSKEGEKSITEIANQIGHSHPSVSKIVREMINHKVLSEKKDKNDGRKNNIRLTAKGKQIADRIEDQYADVKKAVAKILDQSKFNMWYAIEEFEMLLEQKSLLQRVKEEKKYREAKKIQIVPYDPKYNESFKRLNQEWIETYFEMEEADHKALGNPEKYIIDKGGKILFALYENEPVGVCALIKMENHEYDFELAKMAVLPKMKGKGIGYLLGKSVIEEAKSLGAQKLYLESNTILKPAIQLYKKLGFQKVIGFFTPYARCNIQMGLEIKKNIDINYR